MAKTTKRPRLNADKIKKVFKATKSITKTAVKVGGSYAGVRNNLIRQGVLKG
jgi:hypothetical protein